MSKYVLIFITIVSFALSSVAQNNLSSHELDLLDHELTQVEAYDKIKVERIEKLKKTANSSRFSVNKRYEASLAVAKEYETFISDSSLYYFDKSVALATAANDSIKIIESRLGKVKVLGILGLFKEGVTELESIEASPVPSRLKVDWLDAGRQLYAYMYAYVQHDNSVYSKQYNKLLNYYRDEEIKALKKGSPAYILFLAEHYDDLGETSKAKILLNKLIKTVPVSNNIYARATHNMSVIKNREGEESTAAYYLALSAISDIKGSVKENMSLQKLAVYLYSSGDILHAYSYISVSLADAVFCNARLRTAEVSKLMPLIDNAYKIVLDRKQSLLFRTTIVVSVLSICLIFAIIYILRQMRKVKIARQHLKEANSIKEEYIGQFLDLCSIYMERLDNFSKVVSRKITAGQSEELVQMAKSSKFAEDQHRQFYESFDGTFLHIYPTFIEEFNRLLVPEARIEIKEAGQLTTEMRIFAFLRMGVEDSNKIASFLHYSVNTIYAYRNKMKNKAIDRKNFEKNIMKIGSIS